MFVRQATTFNTLWTNFKNKRWKLNKGLGGFYKILFLLKIIRHENEDPPWQRDLNVW